MSKIPSFVTTSSLKLPANVKKAVKSAEKQGLKFVAKTEKDKVTVGLADGKYNFVKFLNNLGLQKGALGSAKNTEGAIANLLEKLSGKVLSVAGKENKVIKL